MFTLEEKIDLLYKKFINQVSNTKFDKWKYFEESHNNSDTVFTNQILVESSKILQENPLISEESTTTSGVIKKWYKTPLQWIQDTKSFYHPDISSIICPDSGYDDTYEYIIWIKDDYGNYTIQLPKGSSDWYLDPDTGILIFINGQYPERISETRVPAITAYTYNGIRGSTPGVTLIGDTGPAGVSGTQGPIGPDSAGMRYRGEWISTEIYTKQDIVTIGNSTYVATYINQGLDPEQSPIYWTLLSQETVAYPYEVPAHEIFISPDYSDVYPTYSSWESAIQYVNSLPIDTHVKINVYPGEYEVTTLSYLIENKSIELIFHKGSTLSGETLYFESCDGSINGEGTIIQNDLQFLGHSNIQIFRCICEGDVYLKNTNALHPPSFRISESTLEYVNVLGSYISTYRSLIKKLVISYDSAFSIVESTIGHSLSMESPIEIIEPIYPGIYSEINEHSWFIQNSTIITYTGHNIYFNFDPSLYNESILVIKNTTFSNILSSSTSRPIMPRPDLGPEISDGEEKKVLFIGKSVVNKDPLSSGSYPEGIELLRSGGYVVAYTTAYPSDAPWNI